MSALSPRGQALVEAARTADRPSPQDRARIRAALALQLGAAVLPAAASSASAAPALVPSAPSVLPPAPVPIVPPPLPAIPMMSGLGVKLIAAGALVSAVGMGVGMISARPSGPSLSAPSRPIAPIAPIAMEMETQRPLREESRPPVVALPSPQESARPLSVPPGSPLSSHARPSSSSSRAPAAALPARPPAPERASPLMEETALLREAQAALKEGDAARSLAAVDALAARHPQGMLREERLAARVLALCAAGRVEEARAEGQRFVAEMPRSIQAERVRASCAFSPKSER